jgi:hypothetical protein
MINLSPGILITGEKHRNICNFVRWLVVCRAVGILMLVLDQLDQVKHRMF